MLENWPEQWIQMCAKTFIFCDVILDIQTATTTDNQHQYRMESIGHTEEVATVINYVVE